MNTPTATFHDTWAGPVPAHVVAFKTTRKGERVIRYRWQRVDGQHCCSAVYVTPEAAALAKTFDRRFSSVICIPAVA